MEPDAQYLAEVVKPLVDHPQNVKITRSVDEMGVLLTLDLHQEDMGKVIGRSGNTAKAIRTLLRVVGMKHNSRVNLKITEPEGSTYRPTGAVGEALHGDTTRVREVRGDAPAMKSIDEAMEGLQ